MPTFALRSLLARRRRAGLSAIAVIVGVAMVAGTFIFTDTIHAALNRLVRDSTGGAEVVVSGRQGLYSTTNPAATVPSALVSRIRRLPGVAAAEGQISDTATIVGRDHRVLDTGPQPALAVSYVSKPFTGTPVVRGQAPRGPSEVAIDQATATRARYHIGDLVPIVTAQPVRRFRLSGLVSFAGASTGGTTVAVFDPAAAAALYNRVNQVNVIYVAGHSGIAPTRLEREIRPLLGGALTARTAGSAVNADVQQLASQLHLLTGGLRAFGFISLFVAAFLIFNALSITVAQRTRELALLRALGALRRQVLTAVVVEALAVGALSSIAGLALGLAAALAIHAVLSAAGVELPSAALVLTTRTAAVSLGLGILVTTAAGLMPGWRATRLAPLQALRESEAPARMGRPSSGLIAAAILLTLVGLALAFGSSGSYSLRLQAAAVGAVMVVLAGVLLSPLVVPYLSGLLAWPLGRGSPVLSRLARQNVTRTPARTALTCSSLMIGLALVLFVLVYVGGVRASTAHALDRSFVADYAIGSADGSSSIPASSVRAAAVVPGVAAASAIKAASGQIGSSGQVAVEGIDPVSLPTVYRFRWVGTPPVVADTGRDDVLVEHNTARAAHLHVGERVAVRTPSGAVEQATVRGIYDDSALLRGFALPLSDFDRLFNQDRLQQVLIRVAAFANRTATGELLTKALRSFPGVVVRSEHQLRQTTAARANTILVLFYALLAISVVMALLGTVNALTLSIHERTRELGTLRALGMSRSQARALIREESVITGTIGTLVGVVLGVLLAWIMTRALSPEGVVFALPWAQFGLVVLVGLATGILAALPPAARAARLDVLQAIATE
jgi:putative ABC transport system permease protein